MNFEADLILEEAIKKTGIDLGILVAEVGLWANPKVHKYLIKENGTGAWRPNVRRAKSGEKKGSITENGELLDDNSMASEYIKWAIGLSCKKDIKGYEACHVWQSACYPIYHTTIANLVLLPRAIASLSDYGEVSPILKYRAFELYGWYPKEQVQPTKPPKYPYNWVNPLPFTDRIRKKLKKRKWASEAKQVI